MQYINNITDIFIYFSKYIPLEPFVLFGSFIEEVLLPFPSPLVLTISGSISKIQQHSIIFILWLAILGSIGKTGGAWVFYILAAKLSHAQGNTEFISKNVQRGWKAYMFLFIARAAPFIPSAALSISCGLISLNLKTYLIATFVGAIVKNLFFLYFGFSAFSSYQSIIAGYKNTASLIEIGIFGLLLIIFLWFYIKRRTRNKIKK